MQISYKLNRTAIQKKCRKKFWTFQKLAVESGVSYSTILALLNNSTRKAANSTILLIARALDCAPADLIKES